ncbi:MAG: hypothetical protein AAB209_11330 [Bacteroidota bacterium]
METKREKKEHFIFSLVRECLTHDDASSESAEPMSERMFYTLLALATLVVGVIASIRWACVNE